MTVILQDTFLRSNVASGWGTGTDGKSWVLDNAPTGTQDVTSNEGHIVNSGTATVPDFIYGSSVTTTDTDVSIRVQFTNTGDECIPLLRRQSAGNFYYGGYDAGSGKQIKKRVANSGTSLASAAFTATTNIFYWIRFQAIGSTLRMRMWQDGTSEPGVWDVTITDTTYTTAGSTGLHIATASTNTVSADHFTVDNTVAAAASQTKYIPRALSALIAYWYVSLVARVKMRVQATRTLSARTNLRTQVNKTLTVRFLEQVRATRTLIARVRLAVTGTKTLQARVRIRQLATASLVARARIRQQATRILVIRIIQRQLATRTLVMRAVMRGITKILQIRAIMRVQKTMSLIARTRIQQLATKIVVARIVERVQGTKTLIVR